MTNEEKRLLLEDLDLVADQNKVVAHTQVDRIFASALSVLINGVPADLTEKELFYERLVKEAEEERDREYPEDE